eukprot:11633647-Alexandrium_andersonii.AAC.1
MAHTIGLDSFPHPVQSLADQGWLVYDYSKKHTDLFELDRYKDVQAKAVKDLQNQQEWDDTIGALQKAAAT